MTDPEDRMSPPADAESEPSLDDAISAPGPGPVPDRSGEAALTAEVELSPTTEVERASAAEVELAPATEVELAPAAEVEPTPPPPVKAPVDVTPAADAPEPKTEGRSRRPEFEEEAEDAGTTAADDLEPIPRWVGLVNTLGVGLVVVMGAWIVALIVQGASFPDSQPLPTGGVLDNDLLHRLGAPFAGIQVVGIPLLALIVAVVLVSLPVLLEEDVTYGQERAASNALVVVVVLAVIICLGAILAVRYTLHGIQAQTSVLPVQRVEQIGFLVLTLGTAFLAAFGALIARGMRYGTD